MHSIQIPLFLKPIMTTINKLQIKALKSVSFTLQSFLSHERCVSQPLLLWTSVGVTGVLCYKAAQHHWNGVDEREIRQCVDVLEDSLAVECVSVPKGSTGKTECMQVHSNAPVDGGSVPEENTLEVQSVHKEVMDMIHVDGLIAYDNSPVDTKLFRRVRKPAMQKYTNLVIAECKMIFGVPTHTEVNRKAVRRTAVKLMKSHGVRPAHINMLVPKIIEMVFVPSKYDLEAKRLAASPAAWKRLAEYAGLCKSAPGRWLNAGG